MVRLFMISIFKERKESQEQQDNEARKLKEEHEAQLKEALARKCADLGDDYSSHEEDETQYTILTINGKSMKVKKEEITIESHAI